MSETTHAEKPGKSPALVPQPHGGALKRGNDVNLTGRPAVKRNAMKAIHGALPEALDALRKQAAKGNVKAIEMLLHYGIGKPTDKVEVSGPDGGPITHVTQDLDDHERRALRDAIARELQRREAEVAA